MFIVCDEEDESIRCVLVRPGVVSVLIFWAPTLPFSLGERRQAHDVAVATLSLPPSVCDDAQFNCTPRKDHGLHAEQLF